MSSKESLCILISSYEFKMNSKNSYEFLGMHREEEDLCNQEQILDCDVPIGLVRQRIDMLHGILAKDVEHIPPLEPFDDGP